MSDKKVANVPRVRLIRGYVPHSPCDGQCPPEPKGTVHICGCPARVQPLCVVCREYGAPRPSRSARVRAALRA